MNSVRYLDASIPLCIQTEDPPEKVNACRRIMEKIERKKELVKTSSHTLAEMFHILAGREKEDPEKVREILFSFLNSAGLRLVDAKHKFCENAIDLALRQKVDFIDAHHVLTMRDIKIGEIYSLDPHFDRFPNIKRLEDVKSM